MTPEIHHAYMVHSTPKGIEHRAAGRFMVHRGKVHHLEDYFDLLQNHVPVGDVDPLTHQLLHDLPPNLRVASHQSLRDGHHPDLIPEAKLQPMPQGVSSAKAPQPRPPSVFHYHREGHDAPHTVEAHGGKFTLDGSPLSDEEVRVVLGNARSGAGKIRYVKSGAQEGLKKADDMDPQDALHHLSGLDAQDPYTRDALASLRRHIMEDPMNPGLGNKYAYEQFRKKNAPGIWASLDLNSLKHLNDTQGHDAGDTAIRAMGHALRGAVDPQTSKAFRAGGDEYVVHFPDHPTAYTAMRNLRTNLENVPAVGGTHKISFSAGLGNDFQGADQALYAAKSRKAAGQHLPGQAPHYAHSNVKGAEGPVPLDPQDLPLQPPPIEPAPKEALHDMPAPRMAAH